MALNVEQITSRLAQMPDAALQKYAAMNKNDPYIMALAVSESNRRKQMRQAAQAQQGQMQQPKVVDAAVQSMAQPMPEDMGIARLPAGDMNFADGGIVAFADGGEVERYQVGGLPPLSAGTEFGVEGMTTGNLYQQAIAKAQQGKPLSDVEKALLTSVTPAAALADTAMLPITAFRKLVRSPLDKSPEPSWFPLTGAATSRIAAELPPQASYSNEGRREPMPAAAPAAPAAPSADKTAPKADATRRVPGAPGAAPAPTPGLPGLQDLAKLRADIYGKQKFEDPAKAEVEALGQEGIAGAQRRQKSFEDFIAKQGDVYKAREERLAKRERDVEGMRNQELGLALFLGGATAAGTVGSIGKAFSAGATAGGQQYAQGIARIRAAQERLADARDKMEELRLNREDMTFKQRSAFEADIDKAKIDAKRLAIDGIRMAADVNEKRASDIFGKTVDLAKTQFEQTEATKRANAQIAATLNTPERQMWNQALAKHGGDTAAAFREMQAAKAEKFNPYQSYADYLKAFAGKENVLSAPMDFTSYVSQFGVPTTTPPKDATIRKLPGS